MTIEVHDAVAVSPVWEGRSLPALVRCESPGGALPAWVSAHRDEVDALARKAGAVLLRGFDVRGAQDFRAVMDALSPQVLAYGERSSPRSQVSDGVYTSTEYPADQPILLHNEQSYTAKWPTRIVFFCERAATEGGRTPLADSRRILARLRPETVDRFERLGVRYVRNYLPGISLRWQEAFQTDRVEDVAAYCARADITPEWVDEDHLRTVQVRPAVRRHPVTGERSWFNHALFFHVTSLDPEVSAGLLEALDEEDLPYNTYYGDGSPIESETLAELRAAYAAETTSFDWQPGDVLVVENMLVAHAREPFVGPRRILTAMADAIDAGEVPA
ncbi:TauD/TfdA family dioxygenase [Streptomyces sp. NPDC005480]|uniref:TauD/TfdA family dioxygenase n=1 Tax=Streptomyces sp. NPDC005480 TaxID=3154880 RepID=UPI0033B20493